MISITVAVKNGTHTRGEILEFEELGPDELSRVHELSHVLVELCEQIARSQAASRLKAGPL